MGLWLSSGLRSWHPPSGLEVEEQDQVQSNRA
jgi:hypothetical protein